MINYISALNFINQMRSRREFLIKSGLLMAGACIAPSCVSAVTKEKSLNVGVQLYSFRDAMAKDAKGTLKRIADLGFKQIESARSGKGHYYGLSATEIKKVCNDFGMTLSSGHVALDENFDKTLEEAVVSGQEYLICSSLPSKGQTVDNYKKVAEAFNDAGEKALKAGVKFGYHNHEYEFDTVNGQVLYDVLMDNTDPKYVYMELDLGWVVMAGKDPLDYFEKYTGRFPLWHLKDMDLTKKHSVEFGKGALDIPTMLKNQKKSGLKYMYVEQEEYAVNPFESMKHNMDFLRQL
jgi:sugar phosphate isomerase/epimerase